MKSEFKSSLQWAVAVQNDASLKGFDWIDPVDALEKVREETGEVASQLDAGPEGGAGGKLEEELGDLLFAAVNVARLAGVDPAAALALANRKFEVRFAAVERIARLRGLPMPGTPLDVLDGIWDEVKASLQ